jgi:WD40 repeat protein
MEVIVKHIFKLIVALACVAVVGQSQASHRSDGASSSDGGGFRALAVEPVAAVPQQERFVTIVVKDEAGNDVTFKVEKSVVLQSQVIAKMLEITESQDDTRMPVEDVKSQDFEVLLKLMRTIESERRAHRDPFPAVLHQLDNIKKENGVQFFKVFEAANMLDVTIVFKAIIQVISQDQETLEGLYDRIFLDKKDFDEYLYNQWPLARIEGINKTIGRALLQGLYVPILPKTPLSFDQMPYLDKSGITPDGSAVVSVDRGRKVYMWTRRADGKFDPVPQAIGVLDETVASIAITSDHATIFFRMEDGTACVWTRQTDGTFNRVLQTRRAPDRIITSAAISSDGTTIAFGMRDGRIFVLTRQADGKYGSEQQRLEVRDGKMITSIAITPDGTTIVSGVKDGRMYVWTQVDGKFGSTPQILRVENRGITSLAIAPDGATIVSGMEENLYGNGKSNRDTVAHVWTHQENRTFNPVPQVLKGETFNPGNRMVIQRMSSRYESEDTTSIAITPDGTIASGIIGKKILVWTRQENGTFDPLPLRPAEAIVMDPCGGINNLWRHMTPSIVTTPDAATIFAMATNGMMEWKKIDSLVTIEQAVLILCCMEGRLQLGNYSPSELQRIFETIKEENPPLADLLQPIVESYFLRIDSEIDCLADWEM